MDLIGNSGTQGWRVWRDPSWGHEVRSQSDLSTYAKEDDAVRRRSERSCTTKSTKFTEGSEVIPLRVLRALRGENLRRKRGIGAFAAGVQPHPNRIEQKVTKVTKAGLSRYAGPA